MIRLIFSVFALATLTQAAVIYKLDISPAFLWGEIHLQYTAPDFLTVDTTVFASDLDYCSVTIDPCFSTKFIMQQGASLSPAILLTLRNSGVTRFSYFEDGTFQTPGVHPQLFPFVNEVGTLTVQAVPEPSSGTLMLVGFAGGIFAVLRKLLLVATGGRGRIVSAGDSPPVSE